MDLRALRRHGWSVSALAREFHLNRRTVNRELAAEVPRRYPPRAPRHPFTPAQLAHIERRLAVCPALRATDLRHELRREYGYAGSYSTFRRRLAPLRPAIPVEPEVRFETAPGVQTQADWKHPGSWPLGDEMVELHAMVAVLGHSRRPAIPVEPEVRFETAPGVQTQADWKHPGSWPLGDEMVELHAMAAVLGHSRRPAIRMATCCTREVSFERLVRCFDDLGGVTREILTDRDTVFWISASGTLSPEWVDLWGLLGTVPRLCRPYRPKTKGKVERVNREIEQSSFLFTSRRRIPKISDPSSPDCCLPLP
jgi:transposase